MKFFTKEWCFSELEDELIEERVKQYDNYIDGVYVELPFVLKLLVKDINLHDGIVHRINYFKDQANLSLAGVFGDLQMGYFFLSIKYLKVHKMNKNHLVEKLNNQFVEVLSSEIEVMSNDRYEHRILFSNKIELIISFNDIELEIRDFKSHDYKKVRCQINLC